ncbi:hypothetical protein GCM10010112_63640 [Actinoplanes lobatus]|uniref:Uncharacterized protein n=1 Tax=Actinoplanes lobatus TaxID=113568 RepID=A0ABQ4AB65_9ACTN|nr:hypothetical protein GCM10010112_63640 [Actinoplanes lobatus]GIE38180.1 hypothetical protein Alo02nite_10780 [Actinoplanes lobatus]
MTTSRLRTGAPPICSLPSAQTVADHTDRRHGPVVTEWSRSKPQACTRNGARPPHQKDSHYSHGIRHPVERLPIMEHLALR